MWEYWSVPKSIVELQHQPEEKELKQYNVIFETNCDIGGNCCSVIVNCSSIEKVSKEVVGKLK